MVGVGAVGLAGLLTWRWRRSWLDAARAVPPGPRSCVPAHGPARAAQPLPEPRPALERPQEVHLHLHGVLAEDVASCSPAATGPGKPGALPASTNTLPGEDTGDVPPGLG
jgi:hypothetical protein